MSAAIAEVDCLCAFARACHDLSSQGPVCRPRFVPHGSAADGGAVLEMEDLWHPCAVAGALSGGGGANGGAAIIPNDLFLGRGAGGGPSGPRAVLLTGPNMGGKSTLLRAACVSVVLAQCGAMVPCSAMTLSPVDTVFTRIGASDRILSGESTFMVECSETAAILHGATTQSLVVLDELGRGTSTFDGYALASACLDHLSAVGCRMLFATHYHSLCDEVRSRRLPVALKHMACQLQPVGGGGGARGGGASAGGAAGAEEMEDWEGEIVFLYKLRDGADWGRSGREAAAAPCLARCCLRLNELQAHEIPAHRIFSPAAVIPSSPMTASISLCAVSGSASAGPAPRSYGLQVATMAGVPPEVVKRAGARAADLFGADATTAPLAPPLTALALSSSEECSVCSRSGHLSRRRHRRGLSGGGGGPQPGGDGRAARCFGQRRGLGRCRGRVEGDAGILLERGVVDGDGACCVEGCCTGEGTRPRDIHSRALLGVALAAQVPARTLL